MIPALQLFSTPAHLVCISYELVHAWETSTFHNSLPKSDRPVGHHFASPGHTTQDVLVSVIRSNFREATDRGSFEARIIFRHRMHTRPCPWWSQCGLWFYTESARSVNVALFDSSCFYFTCLQTTNYNWSVFLYL